MLPRTLLKAVLVASLVVPFVGCSSNQVDSIAVTPGTQSLASGKTAQFTAMALVGHAGHPPQNVTNSVTWTSSDTTVATISAGGLATGVGAGTATITASTTGFGGLISGTATLTVIGGGGGGGNSDIASIAIIPGTQSVASPTQTSQFIAIGTNTTGATENITSSVVWSSSSTQVATINLSGLATAVNQGTTTITALATNPDKTVVTGTATFTVLAGAAEQITSLTVYPGSQAATAQAQQSQFFVLGVLGGSGLTYDETSQVVWTSSNEAVATIGTSGSGTPGLATAVGAGTTTITATWTNQDHSKVVATATYTVTIGAAQEPLLSIQVVPGSITVSNKGMTGQYLAFGTYSTTPTVRDLTNTVTWISLLPEVGSINSGGVTGEGGGLATSQGYGGLTDIYAEATNKDLTVVLSNGVTFSCADSTGACQQDVAHPQFATLTIYNAGENATTWLVTAPSDTGTPNLIHCGPGSTSGGSVCTGTYETKSTVVITASPTGAGFGGWSSGDGVSGGVGCTAAQGYTLLNSPTCTVTLSGDTTIGAIFY